VIYPGKQTVWFFYLMKYFLSLEKGYATARHYIIGILKKCHVHIININRGWHKRPCCQFSSWICTKYLTLDVQ
jgi:hypothetical protein